MRVVLYFSKRDAAPALPSYSVGKLRVHCRRFPTEGHSKNLLICDIDKTYIETNIENLMQMAKVAIEDAGDKQTVPGAKEVLAAAHWHSPGGMPNQLHFLTASPPQLRSVLEEKLEIDAIYWNSITFKDQAYNLLKGKMSLLRQHVAYKTLALHSLLAEAGAGAKGYLIGDNAEYDGFIYRGMDLFLKGALSKDGYLAYLKIAGTDPSVLQELSSMLRPLPLTSIAAIYIREVPGYRSVRMGWMTQDISYFSGFFEVALSLYTRGLLDGSCLWPLTRVFHNKYQVSRESLARSLLTAQRPAGQEPLPAISLCLEKLLTLGGLDLGQIQKTLPPPEELPSTALGEEDILRLATQWVDAMRRGGE